MGSVRKTYQTAGENSSGLTNLLSPQCGAFGRFFFSGQKVSSPRYFPQGLGLWLQITGALLTAACLVAAKDSYL